MRLFTIISIVQKMKIMQKMLFFGLCKRNANYATCMFPSPAQNKALTLILRWVGQPPGPRCDPGLEGGKMGGGVNLTPPSTGHRCLLSELAKLATGLP